MLDSVLQKNVTISLANGAAVIGFVTEMDENFIKIVEPDNSITIVRKNDVSYVSISAAPPVRQSLPQQYPQQEPLDENQYILPHQQLVQQQPQNHATYIVKRGDGSTQQYTMTNPNVSGTSGPKFERQT